MSADDRGTDRTETDEYGGFVFESEGAAAGSEADAPLEERLAPIVALLVVASLVLTGGYIAVTALSGPGEDLLGSGSNAGSGSDGSGDQSAVAGGENGTSTARSPTTRSEASGTTAATAASTASTATTATGDSPRTTVTDGEATDSSTTALPTTDSGVVVRTIAPEAATETPRSIETRAPADPTTVESTAEPTDEPSDDTPTATPESRSPSIEEFAVESGGSEDGSIGVAWAVIDPDDDLETVELTVVADPGGSAEVVSSRTVDVDGDDAESETELVLDGIATGEAYELRLRVEDEAGNTALAVTRETAGE
jgi:hypothetical protein